MWKTAKTSLLQERLSQMRQNDTKVAFVPSLGALHEGHLSLIRIAKERADIVVCSIFVNPTQFNEKSDFEKYPRDIDSDAAKLESVECDILFVPALDEVYTVGHEATTIDYGGLGNVMEGEYRPGHFDGVVEVVARLFDMVRPDVACFGEKDYQQLAIIRQLVAQHDYPIEIVGCPIIREESGLAMSSRNERLSAEQRQNAMILHQTLLEMKERAMYLNPDEVEDFGRETLEEKDFLELEYVKVADSATLQPMFRWHECESARAFIVARFGEVRLIDNMQVWPS